MNPIDPAMADATVVKVVASVVIVILAALFVWSRFYKTRTTVAVDNGDRVRFEEAIADATAARKEAHEANNRVMGVQRQLGRLEAENEACNKRTAALEAENKQQAIRIDDLSRQVARLIQRNEQTDIGRGLT